jgi:hypothetical protein
MMEKMSQNGRSAKVGAMPFLPSWFIPGRTNADETFSALQNPHLEALVLLDTTVEKALLIVF